MDEQYETSQELLFELQQENEKLQQENEKLQRENEKLKIGFCEIWDFLEVNILKIHVSRNNFTPGNEMKALAKSIYLKIQKMIEEKSHFKELYK